MTKATRKGAARHNQAGLHVAVRALYSNKLKSLTLSASAPKHMALGAEHAEPRVVHGWRPARGRAGRRKVLPAGSVYIDCRLGYVREQLISLAFLIKGELEQAQRLLAAKQARP